MSRIPPEIESQCVKLYKDCICPYTIAGMLWITNASVYNVLKRNKVWVKPKVQILSRKWIVILVTLRLQWRSQFECSEILEMNPNTLTKYWIATNQTVYEKIEEKLISDAQKYATETNKKFFERSAVPYWLNEE